MLIGIVAGIVIGGALTYATGLANLFLAPYSSSAEYKSSESATAPDLATGEWINSEPLKLADLRGRVVLIDFWTFGCYNCRNTLPLVKSWNDRYEGKGLTIIGVHSPEFDEERNVVHLRREISSLGIRYPVVTDNDYQTWNAYKVEAWPTVFLLDKQGRIRWMHVGEGDYKKAELLIQKLLAEETSPETKSDSTLRRDFNACLATTQTPVELYQRMLSLHPNRPSPGSLWTAAKVAKPSQDTNN
ncbi:MAG TPA: redoxin domain-containing protein [Blastocatellia bacterium]|nr:redoxin domain-containing protein [Blastocatellia bacterium]